MPMRMKSPLLALLLATMVQLVRAQPALGPGALNPLPGESYTVYFCSFISPGSAGPNQTWDFSAIECTPEAPGTYEDPAGSPYFPTATVLFDYMYLEGNSTALVELG